MLFEDLDIAPQFKRALVKQGITQLTPIQEKAIGPVTSGQDVIGIAPTGTGKTLAFVLPILQALRFRDKPAVRAVILLPSKELASQVYDVIQELTAESNLESILLYGGVGRINQLNALKTEPDIVVSTPARFRDLIYESGVSLKKLEYFVLDEVDRLLGGKFVPQIMDVIELMPGKKQKLLFSATFNERVEELCYEFVEFPTIVQVDEIKSRDNIKQFVLYLPNHLTKVKALEELLLKDEYYKVLVFCKSKESANNTFKYLDRKFEDKVAVITSNKSQNSRLEAFKRLNDDEIQVLVTTDVCARGIDVQDVTHVIQLDVAKNSDEFLHRSGRTGRMNKQGVNISFCNDSERYYMDRVQEHLKFKAEMLNLEVEEQEFLPGEAKANAKEVDLQRQKDDPSYQGAFHQKMKKSEKKKATKKKIFSPKDLKKKQFRK